MFTLQEIYLFISRFERNSPELKEYYNKSYDALKELIKRSNLISFIIVVLIAIYSFSDYIKEFEVLSFKFDRNLIKIAAPLLISFFILEWALIARRRRELHKLLKHIAFFIFNIPRLDPFDWHPFNFSLHSRNVQPFSFMIEIQNIDFPGQISRNLAGLSAILMLTSMPVYVGYTLYNSLTTFKLTTPILVCDLLTIYCFIHIVIFYISDIILIFRTIQSDNQFIFQITNQPIQNPQPPNDTNRNENGSENPQEPS